MTPVAAHHIPGLDAVSESVLTCTEHLVAPYVIIIVLLMVGATVILKRAP